MSDHSKGGGSADEPSAGDAAARRSNGRSAPRMMDDALKVVRAGETAPPRREEYAENVRRIEPEPSAPAAPTASADAPDDMERARKLREMAVRAAKFNASREEDLRRRAEEKRLAVERQEQESREAEERAVRAEQDRREREEFVSENSLASLLLGARATMGKNDLKQVERDLRIKMKFLKAIEEVDPDNLPSEAYRAGYVRAYAKYLQPHLSMTPEETLEKFEKELAAKIGERGVAGDGAAGDGEAASHDAPPNPNMKAAAAVAAGVAAVRAQATKTRAGVAAVSAANRAILPAQRLAERAAAAKRLGQVQAARGRSPTLEQPSASARFRPLLMAGLVVLALGGAVFGGWAMLRSVQQVSAPSGETSVALVIELRDPTAPAADSARPPAAVYEGEGVLNRIYQPPDDRQSRDGPISGIDPSRAGALRPPEPAQEALPSAALPSAPADANGAGLVAADPAADSPLGAVAASEAPAPAPEVAPAAPVVEAFAVRAVEETWISLRDGAGQVIRVGTLRPGDEVDLSAATGPIELISGNAGGVTVLVGDKVYGPLDASGTVIRGITLDPTRVSGFYPVLSSQ